MMEFTVIMSLIITCNVYGLIVEKITQLCQDQKYNYSKQFTRSFFKICLKVVFITTRLSSVIGKVTSLAVPVSGGHRPWPHHSAQIKTLKLSK